MKMALTWWARSILTRALFIAEATECMISAQKFLDKKRVRRFPFLLTRLSSAQRCSAPVRIVFHCPERAAPMPLGSAQSFCSSLA